MSRMLERDPGGKFIWQGQALSAWLPVLLDTACGSAYRQVLEVLMKHSTKESSRELSLAAKFLLDPEVQTSEMRELYWNNVKRAQSEGRRREIIFDALQKLKEEKLL